MLTTATGLQIDVEHMKPADVRAYDIAWSLSNLTRFNGHALLPWDLLSHVGLSYMLYIQDMKGKTEVEFALALLLHNAPKAYLGDNFPTNQLYGDVAAAIYARFLVSQEAFAVPWDMVERYDRQATAIEFQVLFPLAQDRPKPEYEMAKFPILVKATVPNYIDSLKHYTINHGVADVLGLFEVSAELKPHVTPPPAVEISHADVDIAPRDLSGIEGVTL